MATDWRDVDWEDMNAMVSPHFRVHETLWLPSWRIYHTPSTEEKEEIVKTAEVMEKIRGVFDAGVVVHCWMRPIKVNAPGEKMHGENYNRFIGSTSTKSAHIFGRAVDFHISGKQGPAECQKTREAILPYLDEWEMRMEDKAGGWVHIDTNPVGNKRFFKP